jgi:hypothetical protein
MGTRAMYTFKGQDSFEGTHNVYKHWDGYPSHALMAIEAAKEKAWALPRFEADEFAASFVAANKDGGGNIRLMESGEWKDVAPQDLEYRYEIWHEGAEKDVRVAVFAITFDATDAWQETQLFRGSLKKALAKFSTKAA